MYQEKCATLDEASSFDREFWPPSNFDRPNSGRLNYDRRKGMEKAEMAQAKIKTKWTVINYWTVVKLGIFDEIGNFWSKIQKSFLNGLWHTPRGRLVLVPWVNVDDPEDELESFWFNIFWK